MAIIGSLNLKPAQAHGTRNSKRKELMRKIFFEREIQEEDWKAESR
jgi:hypothetical protein